MTRRELLACSLATASGAGASEAVSEPIDSHVHIHRDAPRLLADMQAAGWRTLSICVSAAMASGERSDLDGELRATARQWRASHKRLAWAATFDARPFEIPDFAERTIASLRQCFDQGACGVKVWKNVGLGIRSKSGAYLLPDHPALMPVYEAVEKSGKTLLVHLAGTSGGWMPIDRNNPEYSYYKVHPEWNLYGRAGAPTKPAIMAARNRVLARFPKLRVVGCHIGSMEDDLDGAARHLDQFPNLVLDTAAKVRYLAHGNREHVRQFLLRYRDRILYATDFSLGTGDEARAWNSLRTTYQQDWKFFAGGEPMTYQGREVQGLALPDQVLRQVFHENARRWLEI